MARALPAAASTRLLPAEALSRTDLPQIGVVSSNPDGLDLVFELPALAVERFSVNGRDFQSVAIPGGGLQGETGQPGIPTFTRMVAIPDGATVLDACEMFVMHRFLAFPVLDEQHRIIRRDGAVRWLEVRSQTFFEDDGEQRRPARTIGAMVDITSRVAEREALQRLLDLLAPRGVEAGTFAANDNECDSNGLHAIGLHV